MDQATPQTANTEIAVWDDKVTQETTVVSAEPSTKKRKAKKMKSNKEAKRRKDALLNRNLIRIRRPIKRKSKDANKHKDPILKLNMKINRPTSSDKFFDLDDRALALGVFVATLKQKRLQNDPHFIFTPGFYKAATQDFSYLNDENMDKYIAQANKRNTIEDPIVLAALKRTTKPTKVVPKIPVSFFNSEIDTQARLLYEHAVTAVCQRDDPNFTPDQFDDTAFTRLDDYDRAPYLAGGLLFLVDRRAFSALELARSFLEVRDPEYLRRLEANRSA